MSGREVAWRVFAAELGASLVEEHGAGDRAPTFLLSPLGARMNRVLMAGTLAPGEAVGGDPAQPFVRSRLTDPTGAVAVTAGGFQPRALAALGRIDRPAPCVLVGKPQLYRGRSDGTHLSVRAEAIRPIDRVELEAFTEDALIQTSDRLQRMEQLRAGTPAPRGDRPALTDAARTACERYPTVDLASFRGGLAAALRSIERSERPGSSPPTTVTITRDPRVAARPEPVSAAGRAQESMFLDLVDELSDRSVDGYADLRETLGLAGRRGVPPEAAEQLLNRLEEDGVLEEPIVGKLRRA